MKTNLIARHALALTVTLTTVGFFSAAFAGTKDGGGGGALVCRNQNGKITQVELLDLWESRELRKHQIKYDDVTSVEEQVQNAIKKIATLDDTLAELTAESWKHIQDNNTEDIGPNIALTPPTDAYNQYFKPGCPLEGMMYYDGSTDKLKIKFETFNLQKRKTEIAASYIHEAFYRAVRMTEDLDFRGPSGNSIYTRLVVGCIFSPEDLPSCLGLKAPDLTDNDFKCSSSEYEVYIKYLDHLNPVSSNVRRTFTRLGKYNLKFPKADERNCTRHDGCQIQTYDFNSAGFIFPYPFPVVPTLFSQSPTNVGHSHIYYPNVTIKNPGWPDTRYQFEPQNCVRLTEKNSLPDLKPQPDPESEVKPSNKSWWPF